MTGIGCARAASGDAAAAPPSATINSRRPMVTVIRPSRARCVKGTIPRYERAVFTFKRAGMLVASASPADSGRTLEGTDPTVNRSFAWERTGFWFDAAVAQEGYFGHDHDKWHHGFYQTLERPDTKSPCCNLTDCRPTSGRQVDGHYEVKVNGAWVSVPSGKILKQSAPDLGFHVCAPFKFDGQPDHLYCVVVPPEI